MMQQHLKPTFFLNFESEHVVHFLNIVCSYSKTPEQNPVVLYYAVRDQIRYDPNDLQYSRTALKASSVFAKKEAICVAKAVLLAAGSRQQDLPSQFGFADDTNYPEYLLDPSI